MERDSLFLGRKNQYCENDYIPNAIYRFNAIPIKLPMAFFHRTRTKNFTIHMETQKTLNSQISLEKNGAGRINLPDFRLYYKATVKTVWSWYRPMEQDRKPRNKPMHLQIP